MAVVVQRAFLQKRHLVVEAGTGIGKSFAYLVPAIDIVHRLGVKVLISTFTITLQEQLINKDLPFLADSLPLAFTAVLAKGRGNYLCRRRLEFALRGRKRLFDDIGSGLAAIKNWADSTEDGSLSDISFQPRSVIWDAVKSEHGNCRGRKCPYSQECFYQRARRELESADIIVANHALMFSDLALKQQGTSVLPDYRFVCVDEAHNVEGVAEDHFGIDISNRKIQYLLGGLYNTKTHKGLLTYTTAGAEKAVDIVDQLNAEAKIFFNRVSRWYEETRNETNGRCYKNFVDDNISGYLTNLMLELTKLAKRSKDEDEKFEIARFIDRCGELAGDLGCFLTQQRADYVYWVEATEANIRLRSAALNVAGDVKRCLFDKFDSVILTSATLSSDGDGENKGFDFFAGRVGLEDFEAVKLGSPFDYQNQVTVYLEKDLPNPNESAFIEKAGDAIKKYVLRTAGRAFVLFTSYSMLDEVAGRIADWLSENNIKLLQQGCGLDRTTLLEHFKKDSRSILLGTDSFWQGVDVPGHALGNVIIVRLPFAAPNRPLLAGRLEQIKKQGGDPFFDYQLPLAIIKFKQGFGRLIRSKTDKGIVVVLDSRIIKKSYGQRFLAAIPKCETKVVHTNKSDKW